MESEPPARTSDAQSGAGIRSRRSAVTAVSGGGISSGGGTGTSNAPPLPGEASRREFLSYMLSLMRGASDEHADLLPIVDLGAYRHVAYVTDAFFYLIKEISETPVTPAAPGAAARAPPEAAESEVSWDDVALGRGAMEVADAVSLLGYLLNQVCFCSA